MDQPPESPDMVSTLKWRVGIRLCLDLIASRK